MTERRRALTLPFNVDKDKLVPWTAIAGCKLRHSSQHKNVSMKFEHNHTAMVQFEMVRRTPCLILTDVLKTEPGIAYMERIKQNPFFGNGEQLSSTPKETGRCREESPIRRETRSTQRETRNDKNNKSMTTKCNQKTTTSSAKRSRNRRRLQTHNNKDTEESKDIDEVIIGKDNREDGKFAEVVDCGLSVSWDPAEDNGSCDEFSPNNIKDRWNDPANEVQHSLKRKRKDTVSECNGTGSPKRHRESVLRLTGEDGRDGGPAQTRICFEESREDLDLESLDRSIVQFTVGADERTDVLLPIINPNLEVRDFIGTPRRSLSSSQDDTTKNSPSEPIVLSSDDEESSGVSQHRRPAVQKLVSVEGTVIRGQSSQEVVAKQFSDMQLLQVVLEDLPASMPACHSPTEDNYLMSVAFTSLYCGGYRGMANGDIMIADQNIMIPLKDASEQVEVMLTLEREELRRYSVWEQEELEDRGLRCKDEELPPAVLLFLVSETAAAAVQWDLHKLCVKQDGTTNTGKASPFILLTLRDPLKGMEGALFRSLLDIDCLKNLGHEKSSSFVIHDVDGAGDLEDIHSPTLSLDDSLELIRRTGLDPHLLSLVGLESTDPDPGTNTDQDSAYSDRDSTVSPHIELEVDSQKETEPELETAPDEDTGMQLKPDEDQKEQELEHPPEKSRKEPTPEFTLCHCRTKGSYSVSLCKADSSWTKYKHQGLARRLIQFPPPPLKGGITVTMEDLQCLDNGQFLNDVIIDFYLKYLLQNTSDAVAERSHIFSSFFYKQLTRRDNASEGGASDSCQRQRRHQRVKTWTRHVDIFKKDFLFVPVNQEAHWYLVVICFPGLEEPTFEAWIGPDSTGSSGTGKVQDQEDTHGSKRLNDKMQTTSNYKDNLDTATENAQEDSTKETPSGPVNCTEQTYKKKIVCKRPCILIMDSLRLSLHERVFKLLREYLQSEWEARRGSTRDFGPDQMKNSHCKVPLQDNSSDCGLYLLQYVESFLKDPVVHFDLPLHLENWFPRQQVRRKRDQIRDLVLNLYRHQNLDNNR